MSGLQFPEPTPIQNAVIPHLINDSPDKLHYDVLIQDATGTGKTLAYLLPILSNIDNYSENIQAIIMAPTRELAVQIHKVAQQLSKGGSKKRKQNPIRIERVTGALTVKLRSRLQSSRPHVLIGTPDMLERLVFKKTATERVGKTTKVKKFAHPCVDAQHLRYLVMDEVDHLFSDFSRRHPKAFLQRLHGNPHANLKRIRQFADRIEREKEKLRMGGETETNSKNKKGKAGKKTDKEGANMNTESLIPQALRSNTRNESLRRNRLVFVSACIPDEVRLVAQAYMLEPRFVLPHQTYTRLLDMPTTSLSSQSSPPPSLSSSDTIDTVISTDGTRGFQMEDSPFASLFESFAQLDMESSSTPSSSSSQQQDTDDITTSTTSYHTGASNNERTSAMYNNAISGDHMSGNDDRNEEDAPLPPSPYLPSHIKHYTVPYFLPAEYAQRRFNHAQMPPHMQKFEKHPLVRQFHKDRRSRVGIKKKMLTRLHAAVQPRCVIVFFEDRKDLDRVEAYLTQKGFRVGSISSQMDKKSKSESVKKAESGHVDFILATDMASRGLDIKNITMVVNFDLPSTAYHYLHRAGRVGRTSSSKDRVPVVVNLVEEYITSSDNNHNGESNSKGSDDHTNESDDSINAQGNGKEQSDGDSAIDLGVEEVTVLSGKRHVNSFDDSNDADASIEGRYAGGDAQLHEFLHDAADVSDDDSGRDDGTDARNGDGDDNDTIVSEAGAEWGGEGARKGEGEEEEEGLNHTPTLPVANMRRAGYYDRSIVDHFGHQLNVISKRAVVHQGKLKTLPTRM